MVTENKVRRFGYLCKLASCGITPDKVEPHIKQADFLDWLKSGTNMAMLLGVGLPAAVGIGGAYAAHALSPSEADKEEYGEEMLAKRYRMELQKMIRQARDKVLYHKMKQLQVPTEAIE